MAQLDIQRAGLLSLTLSTCLLTASACSDLAGDPGQDLGTGGWSAAPGSGGSGSLTNTGGVLVDDTKIDLGTGGLGSGGTTMDMGGAGGGTIDTTVTTECARTDVSAVDTTRMLPADIIILVDTSGSMGEEAAFVQQNLNAFSQQITESGVDARVILLAQAIPPNIPEELWDQTLALCIDPPLGSGECPDDTNLPNYVHLDITVSSRNALNVIVSNFDSWKEYIREDSVKSILVVTDDNASGWFYGGFPYYYSYYNYSDDPTEIAASFISQFEALDPDLLTPWSMNAVYSFTQCPQAARIGTVYEELVALTGGVSGDLCLQDFQPVFDRLAQQVVENAGSAIACEWDLPAAVDGQSFSTELVEVTRTSGGGLTDELSQVSTLEDCEPGAWHFDDPTNPSRILACPETCEGMQDDAEGKIDVVFGCEVVEGCSASGASVLVSVDPAPPGEAGAPSLGQDVGCQWPLPEADAGKTLDLGNVNVRYVTSSGFGVLLGQVADATECDSADLAWHYDDPQDPSQIVTCARTCETLKDARISRVEALFGCKTKLADVVK